jgi:hypothetical protein
MVRFRFSSIAAVCCVLICLSASGGWAEKPSFTAAPLAPGIHQNMELNQTLAVKMKFQKPLKKGTISSFASQQVQLGGQTTAPLKMIADTAFKPLNRYTDMVSQKAVVGKTILSKPVVMDEVVEFDDSFILRKSTTVNVLDPEQMQRISPTFRSFLARRGKVEKVSVRVLDPDSRRGLADLMKIIHTLDPADPIRQAAQKGDQAVLDAIMEGKGELTIEDTIVIPKMIPMPVKGVTMYPSFKDGRLNFKQLQPVRTQVLKDLSRVTPPPSAPVPMTHIPMQQMTMVPKNTNTPELSKTGKHYFTAEFLAGFTKGHSWQWERRWKYRSGFFRVTIGGGYGFGLRVPVLAQGEISPTKIWRYDVHDARDKIEGKMTVTTLDANESFYRKTGLSPSKLFRANEVVLEYQMGFGYKLRALWKDLAHKPFGGYGINYSQNARPPFGEHCANCGFRVPIPPEITRTTFDYSVMTGFVQTGFHVSGSGKVFFKFTPYVDDNPANSTSLMFNGPGYQPFEFSLLRLTPPQGKEMVSGSFGFKISDLVYRMGLSITPEVRVGVSAGYKGFSRTFTTNWIALNMFKLRMGTVQLYTHEGTRPDYTFTGGSKTYKKIQTEKFDPKKAKLIPKLKTN